MNLKLATQLYEADFPKKDFKISYPNKKYPNKSGQRGTPTLSELIEACGDDFESLIKTKTKDGYEWNARSYNYFTTGFKTPEEAVVKLWLKLNK